MATVIESDLNRYEVVKVLNPDNKTLNVSIVPDSSGPTSVSGDAFGRLRTSNPLTLFDSSHRYSDNNLWEEETASGGSSTFNANEGLVDLDVTTTSGSKIYRETLKVFSYQPGKSLLILNTFVFNEAKENLRQRVGYFGSQNGIYIELNDSTLSFVERSSVTGYATETRVFQANWNIDRLDGSGQSGITLDITKAQIMWMDVEWLGLGTVRLGFVIDGKFIHCHSFHHANIITSTYITTASLPLRYEIENTGATASNSKLKQVCSTVISEGGYELRGAQQAATIPIGTPTDLTVAGTYYPLISLRLKASPDRLDAIVILTAVSILGFTNNAIYNWQGVSGGTTTGGTWVSASANSSVEYNVTGTAFTQGTGRVLASGFAAGSNQGTTSVDILKEALFTFQLERNSFTSTPRELTLIAASDSAGADVYAALDWEEISR
jgi:hypothetical protein